MNQKIQELNKESNDQDNEENSIESLQNEIEELENGIEKMNNDLDSEKSIVISLEKKKIELEEDFDSKNKSNAVSGPHLKYFHKKCLIKNAWISNIGFLKSATIQKDNRLNLNIHNDFISNNHTSHVFDSNFSLDVEFDPSSLVKTRSAQLSGGCENANIQFSDITRFSGGDIHSMVARLWFAQNDS
ncbi:hypothetical protein AYI70_g9508 [Smittium culicis]|uniref:Uncharacterized protein n=1 Tax=Smittium culicis TaxID=133412 RepID=A0A1R1XAU3_9FUNG|nr:hypothetical protein AYI70_g9508 [Smittium culicis]